MINKVLKIIPIIFISFLVGCKPADTLPDPQQPAIITKNVVLLIKLPDSVLLIPPQVEAIDLDKATQREVADWIIRNEQRIIKLETNLKIIQNALAATIKKEGLKEGDYRIIELTIEELAP